MEPKDAYTEAIKKVEGYNPFVDIPKRVIIVENINNVDDKFIRGCQTNHIFVLRNCNNAKFYVSSNQRVHVSICLLRVIATRTVRAINCKECTFIFEDVDARHFECYNVTDSKAIYIDSAPVVENCKVHWRKGCARNIAQLGRLKPRGSDGTPHAINFNVIKVWEIPEVPADGECESYFDEMQNLHHLSIGPDIIAYPSYAKILEDLYELAKIPFTMTNDELAAAYDREREEYEEPIDSVREKVREVIDILKNSKHTVAYSGAGISTAANIPDFRGPNGVWTNKAKGKYTVGFSEDDIRPTFSHYAITELARRHLINFVISTNMDALHMRSGLPAHMICEQHGNGNKEVCEKCRKAYYRQYRTSYATDFFTHHTGRLCDFCNGNLRDTIVNFSEVLADEDMNASLMHARKSEAAIVLGTSMNVQPAASFPEKCFRNNGQLIIVNLQKTPYDSMATVRIFAKTDTFTRVLMEELGIQEFDITYPRNFQVLILPLMSRSTDKLDTWDLPTKDVPLPLSMQKRFDDMRRKERLWKWIIPATGVVVALVAGLWRYQGRPW